MVMCGVEYKTLRYDDSVATMNIAENRSVSITLPGNRYATSQDTVGIYRFFISANEYEEICSMLNAEQFRKGPSQEFLSPGDPYRSIIFKQVGQRIEKLAAGGVELTPYMKDIFAFFETMFQDNIKSRQPAIGLSCSIEDLKTDVNGHIQFSAVIINKGKIPFSIPAFGTEGFFLEIGLSGDTHFDLDDKYVTNLAQITKEAQFLLHTGEQYSIDYSIDKSRLSAKYDSIYFEPALYLAFEDNKEPCRFALIFQKDF